MRLNVDQLDGTQTAGTQPATYWSIRATKPAVVRLIVAGKLPSGFVALLPYKPVPPNVRTLVNVSIQQPGSGSTFLRDNDDHFDQAKAGLVLARGHYYTPAEFQSKFATCRN
jgi:hypothetical protein